MRKAAAEVGVKDEVWSKSLFLRRDLGEGRERVEEEWEAWCDPGTVVWQYGGWEWEDVGFEPTKLIRGESSRS
jgi:hypothetical protein